MDHFGQLVFYFDYERDENRRRYIPKRNKGFIVKSYKYIGADGIILHAYNGVKYFLSRFDYERTNFSPYNYLGEFDTSRYTDYTKLNFAFDILFDLEEIEFGYDHGIDVLHHIEENVDYYKSEESLENDLFGGDSEAGILSITFTGNPKDGYFLKYRYYYDKDYVDLKSAMEAYHRDFGGPEENGDIIYPEESYKKAVDFFHKYAENDGKFEGDDCIGYIREIIADKKKRQEAAAENEKRIEALHGTDDAPIEALNPSVRAFNRLKIAKINLVGELRKLSPDELASIMRMRKELIDEITDKLAEWYKTKPNK